VIVLFRYAPGSAPGKRITPEQSHSYGFAIAAMHQDFNTLTDRCQHLLLNLQRLLDAPIAAIMPWLADRSDDAIYLTQLAEILTTHASALSTTSPLYDLCHGGLHKANLLWITDQ